MVVGVRNRLLEAIKVRLRADVKVGVALSGGIDSSMVAGMVNHLIREGEKVGSDATTERLSCFGIAFDKDSGFDESHQSSLGDEQGPDKLTGHWQTLTRQPISLASNSIKSTWMSKP